MCDQGLHLRHSQPESSADSNHTDILQIKYNTNSALKYILQTGTETQQIQYIIHITAAVVVVHARTVPRTEYAVPA